MDEAKVARDTAISFGLFALVLLVLRWTRLAWVHLPAALWGAGIALGGFICPLTPLENWLRERAGGVAYTTGFIEHYLQPILYPVGLTRDMQWVLGSFALAVNVTGYTLLWRRRRLGRGR